MIHDHNVRNCSSGGEVMLGGLLRRLRFKKIDSLEANSQIATALKLVKTAEVGGEIVSQIEALSDSQAGRWVRALPTYNCKKCGVVTLWPMCGKCEDEEENR